MSEQAPRPGREARVRVVSPQTARARPRPRRGAAAEIDAQSALGAVYVGALLRAQLRRALLSSAVLVGSIGLLPLLFHLAPGLGGRSVLGMPLPWLLLAFGCYPVIALIAWRHLRAAERLEDEFVHVVERT